MWQRFQNLIFSLKTYDALSPDLKVRQQVNHFLRQRPAMDCQEWFETFYRPQGVLYPVVSFVYDHLSGYSGLEIGRVLPGDRFQEDLCWTQVCWFDWESNLFDDFFQHFGVDISDCLDASALLTVADLIAFLNRYGSLR